ncbi:calcium-binding protein [Microvirga roseola]|uniref:calcium-binding protein n=1 Tax=Microvirga roseola TaxID=2883126 RepID=UPI002AC322E8|nr:calcium-binding protein [Microvirga roseola]
MARSFLYSNALSWEELFSGPYTIASSSDTSFIVSKTIHGVECSIAYTGNALLGDSPVINEVLVTSRQTGAELARIVRYWNEENDPDVTRSIEELQSGGFDAFAHIMNGEKSCVQIGSAQGDTIIGVDTDTDTDDLNGRSGNDILIGGAGGDILSGDDGFDYASYQTASAGVIVSLSGYPGSNTGDAHWDRFYGVEGLIGSAHSDHLIGNRWKNHLLGGNENDTLSGTSGDGGLFGEPGDDTLDGGSGIDTAQFRFNRADYDIADAGDGHWRVSDRTEDRDGTSLITNIEFLKFADQTIAAPTGSGPIYGTPGADSLSGTPGVDTIYGGGSNDTVRGGDDSDIIYGDADDDDLYGNAGADSLVGGAGDDELSGDMGDDTLIGGSDNDFMWGSGGGNDVFDGGEGTDKVSYYGASSIQLYMQRLGDGTIAATDASRGVAAGDTFIGVEIIDGTAQADTIEGTTGAQTFWGAEGADVLAGSEGSDELNGSEDNDILDGGADNDTVVFAGNREDYMISKEGEAFIVADKRSTDSDGTDTVLNMEIFRFADGSITAGNLINTAPTAIALNFDVVAENTRTGTAFGQFKVINTASDTHRFELTDTAGGRFAIDAATGALGVADGVRLDHEQATRHSITVKATDGAGASVTRTLFITVDDVLNETATGGALGDLILGGAGRDIFSGAGGNDTLDGGASHDRLNGESGNDKLSGGKGKDSLTGGTGRDTFAFGDKETGRSKSKADYVLDFSGRQKDKLDLKAVDANTKNRGDQKFSFIGDKEAFTKAGQVRYEKTKKYTYVYLNTDNEKSAEAVIKLKGSIDLSKSRFVL